MKLNHKYPPHLQMKPPAYSMCIHFLGANAQMFQQSCFLPAIIISNNLNDRLQNIIYKFDFKFTNADQEIIKKS